MDMIGVIFNLSGTILIDREIQLDSWRLCIEDLLMQDISNNDVLKYIDGKGGQEIIEHFLGNELSKSTILQFQEEKDRIFRSLIVKEHPQLVPGLTDFLDYLSKASVSIALVTTQSMQNVNLIYDEYDLYRWFDWNHVIMMSDGISRIPSPSLYTQAAKQLQTEPRHCLSFSAASDEIHAAYDAGIRNITYISETASAVDDLPGVIKIIRNYTELT